MTDITKQAGVAKESKKSTPKELPPDALQGIIKNSLTSIWFSGDIHDYKSCTKLFDLKPDGALCLLIMATENATSSKDIQRSLHGFGGGLFHRDEAAIVAENGLYSLQALGFLKLDAKGEKELEAHDHSYYGLGDVQWKLTAKGARRIVPTYCSCKGLPSDYQDQAVKDILAANKAAIAKNRKR